MKNNKITHNNSLKKVKSTHTQARTKYEPTVTVRHTHKQSTA